jgi:hypothetical protein
MLGIGLGFAIILGLSASVGSLVPLLVLTPQKVGTSQGHLYFLGTAVMLIGIVAAARAGSLRDLSKKPVDSIYGVKIKGSFIARLVVAISAGLLSSALNFSYAFGPEPSRRHAIWGSLLFGCQTLWQLRQQVAASLPIAFIACASCTRTPRREISGSRTCGSIGVAPSTDKVSYTIPRSIHRVDPSQFAQRSRKSSAAIHRTTARTGQGINRESVFIAFTPA